MSGSGASLDDSGFGDPDTLAGEFVLGVLTAEEMRAVRVRSRVDPALAAAIAAWELRLSPLALMAPPQAPPPALWSRLEQAIAALPIEADPVPPPRAARLRPRRVWPWQLATGASLALAAGFAALALLPPPATEQRVAALGPVGAPPAAFLADARANGSVTLTPLAPAEVPQGRDLELWVLPPGAQKVSALGVLPVGGRQVSLAGLPATGTQLLVSLEPRGGSPTGQPTGAVLYAGTLATR